MTTQIWDELIELIKKENPQNINLINPPASKEAVEKAKKILGPLFHEDLAHIYEKTDGFATEAYLLMNTYRILPVAEMLEKSLKLVGEVLTTDVMAGEYRKNTKLKVVIFAIAKADDEDIQQLGFSLRKNKSNLIIWYKEGGIHTFEEVVVTGETLTEWLAESKQYYC